MTRPGPAHRSDPGEPAAATSLARRRWLLAGLAGGGLASVRGVAAMGGAAAGDAAIGGASGSAAATGGAPAGGAAPVPLRVVASFSILADIARQVAGDAATVETLVGPDSDAHVFEPTPVHARRVAAADLVVVNGLGFEGWMPRLVAASGYRGPVLVASDGVPVRRLGAGSDPHVWQDLSHGRRIASNVAQALRRLRPAAAEPIARRSAVYATTLDALDRTTRARFERIPRARRRALCSHDAFGYFGAAYGIEFVAPLPAGNESEPSAATVGRLIARLHDRDLHAVFIENIADPRLVGRIARDAGVAIGGKLYSDALSRAGGEADSYLALFAHNAATIAAALERGT